MLDGKKAKVFFENLSSPAIFFILFSIGVIFLGRVLVNGFVGDDTGYINHPFIQHFMLGKLFLGSSSDLGGESFVTGNFYRPLMLVVLSIIYSAVGNTPFLYHLIQLLLYICNAFLVFILLKKFSSNFIALSLSLLFLLHPINIESLAYVSNFQDIMFVFFGLIAINILLLGKLSKIHSLSIMVFLFLSCLSKETGLLFVAIAFFCTFIFKKKSEVSLYLQFFCLFLLYIFLRYALARVGLTQTALSPIGTLSPSERLAQSPHIFAYYIKTLFLPVKLAIGQTWIIKNNVFEYYQNILLSILIILVLLLPLRALQKDKKFIKDYLFFLVWFFLGIIVHLQIIPLEMTVADRWFYFPFIGLLGITSVVISKLSHKKTLSFFAVSVILVSCILLGIRSYIRLGNFSNALNLYAHDSKVTNSYLLEHSYGYELMQKGDMKNAKIHLVKSVDLFETPFNTNSLGVFYFRENNIPSAILWFHNSVSLGDYFLAYQNYGRLLLKYKTPKESVVFLDHAVRVFPKSDVMFFLLTIAQYKNGEVSKALSAATQAYTLSPSQQNAYVLHQLQNNLPIIILDN